MLLNLCVKKWDCLPWDCFPAISSLCAIHSIWCKQEMPQYMTLYCHHNTTWFILRENNITTSFWRMVQGCNPIYSNKYWEYLIRALIFKQIHPGLIVQIQQCSPMIPSYRDTSASAIFIPALVHNWEYLYSRFSHLLGHVCTVVWVWRKTCLKHCTVYENRGPIWLQLHLYRIHPIGACLVMVP